MPARLIAAGMLAAVCARTPVGAAEAPDLDAVLARAASYVDDFREQLSGIVAEETYLQQETPGRRRELRSDLVLVRSTLFPRWLQFRDTFEVDGRAVRERSDRLTGLFRQPLASAAVRARQIAEESSRYNVGPVLRTINVPLMPLVFLEADVQERFRFSRARDAERPEVGVDPPGHFRVTTEVWVVRFEERSRPTIVRDPLNRRDVPSRGRFWIEPQTGRVLMSEMESNHPEVRVQMTVSYQSEPLLGLLVPVAMRETYTNRSPHRTNQPGWETITATAVYGKFRQVNAEPRTLNPEPRTPNPEPNLNTNREP